MFGGLPALDDEVLVHLFHKGARVQWTSWDFEWVEPVSFSETWRRALARVLTPVYLGEQTAMLGAASVMGEVARAGQASAQLYLASFILDEARHFESLTRLYRHLGHDPVRVRELPDMLRYHHRLRQGDKLDWVWGILISDVFARHFYHAFLERYPRSLIGQLSQRIVVDEGRHQAFAEAYLTRALPAVGEDRRRALRAMRGELLALMERMQQRLQPDMAVLELDGRWLLDRFAADIEARTRRLGIGPDPGPGGGQPGGRPPSTPPASGRGGGSGGSGGSGRAEDRPGGSSPQPDSRAATGPDATAGRGPASPVTVAAAGCTGCALALLCAGAALRAGRTAETPAVRDAAAAAA